MKAGLYEIPKTVVALLRSIGPIHSEVTGDYLFAVRVAVGENDTFSGFIIEQRLAERSMPAAEGKGLSFKVPVRAEPLTEATYVFAETLEDVLAYTGRPAAPGS